MPNADVAWVDVLPSMRGFGSALARGVGDDTKAVGQQAGRQFGSSFSTAAVSGVEAASAKMSAALRGVQDAAGKVHIAETRLNDLRQSSKATATQIVTAEENLARARRNETAANENLAVSSRRVREAQDQHTAAQRQGAAAMDETTKRAGILTRTFGSMQGAVIAGFAAFAAARAAIGFVGGTIKAASDLNEEINKSTVVFGTAAQRVLDFSKTSASSLGQSQREALGAAGTFGNLFRTIGLTDNASADMSIRLVTLASDLASFNNADPSEVLEAMRAGLVGETEPMRRFGVDISDASMRAEALKEGLKVGPVLTQQQKAQLAYQLMLKQTTLAQGDFQRTSDGLANSQRILSAEWENSKAKLGALLIGPMTAIVKWTTDHLLPTVGRAWDSITQSFTAFANAWKYNDGDITSSGIPGMFERLGYWAHQAWDVLANYVIPAIRSTVGYFADNQVALYALVGAFVAWRVATAAGAAVLAVQAAGGLALWLTQTQLATKVSAAWTAVQWLLNASFLGFPLVWIVAALAAVVIGIIELWKHSETFRDIVLGVWSAIQTAIAWAWENVLKPTWEAIKVAWAATVTAMQWAWENILKPVWEVLESFALSLWDNILAPVFRNIQHGWEILVTAVQWAWDNVLHPTWNVVATVATWLWENVLQPIFAAIGAAFGVLVTAIKWYWDNILHPVFDVVMAVAKVMFDFLTTVIFIPLGLAWAVLLKLIELYWNTILHPVFEAIAAVAGWLWNNMLHPFFDQIGEGWNKLLTGMDWVWQHVLSPAFDAIKTAVGLVKEAFDDAIQGVQTAWDKIKGIVAVPINFVVRTVLRDGLFSAWNWVLDQLGISSWHINLQASWLQGIAGYAAGGQVAGFSPTRTADNIPAMLTAREYVQPVDTVDYYGVGVMDAMRRKEIPRAVFGMASGGMTWQELDKWRAANLPGSILTSGYRPGAADYHGRGQAIDIGAPGNNQATLDRFGAQVASYWSHANEVIHNPNASIKDGHRTIPPAPWGAATWAAHRNHVHLAVDEAGLKLGGTGGTGLGSSGFGSAIEFFNHLKNAIGRIAEIGQSPFFRGVAEMPGQLLSGMWNMIKDTAASFFERGTTPDGDNTAPAGLDAIKAAVQSVFATKGWGGGNQWAALDWLVGHESGWNPRAQNPVSSASGLFQHVDGTWIANRPAGVLATHMKDATITAQAQAGMKYIGTGGNGARPFRDPLSAKSFWETHHWYGLGGQVLDGGGLWHPGIGLNMTGDIERVLSPEQDDYWRRFVDAVSPGGGAGITRKLADSITLVAPDRDQGMEIINGLWHRIKVIDRGGVHALED